LSDLLGSQPSLEAQQDYGSVSLGMPRMRDMIKKALQLGFAQRLCLFTLTDEFSPLLVNLKMETRHFIMR
jgi:hypothetical protein